MDDPIAQKNLCDFCIKAMSTGITGLVDEFGAAYSSGSAQQGRPLVLFFETKCLDFSCLTTTGKYSFRS